MREFLWTRLRRVGCAGFVLGLVALVAAGDGVRAVAGVVGAPDVVDAPPSRVVLQIIDNVFHKWSEYDVQDTGVRFIVQHEPIAGPLNAEEAERLLAASSGWMEGAVVSPDGYSLSVDDPRLGLPPLQAEPFDGSGLSATDALGADVAAPPVATVPPDWELLGPSPDIAPQIVIGTDDRVRVTNTTAYPWSTIGYVGVVFPNGGGFRGTGFLVAPHVVLTNAHNVYSPDNGGYVRSLEFAPGQHQASSGATVERPLGSRNAVRVEVNQTFVGAGRGYTNTHTEHDYAAAFIETPFAGVTTYMPLVFNYGPVSAINIAGYPLQVRGERNSEAMWFSSGNVTMVGERVIEYTADSTAGNSGGPAWLVESHTGQRRVVGVHAYEKAGQGVNGATRLTSYNQQIIEGWMRWAPVTNRPLTVRLTYSPAQPTTQDTIVFTATASDPDGDPLTYRWFLNNVEQTGISPGTLSTVRWERPSAGSHTMRVLVSDGRGGSAEDSVAFTVRSPTAPPPDDSRSHRYGGVGGWYLVSTPAASAPPAGVTMWHWNASTGRYERPGTLHPHVGYWALLSAHTQWSVASAPPASDVSLNLRVSGWHLVSAPWPYLRSAILVSWGGRTLVWADAVAAGWVQNTIFGFKATDGAYTSPTSLHPWYGYWLFARVPGVTLRFMHASRGVGMVEALSLEPEALARPDLPPIPGPTDAHDGVAVESYPNPLQRGDTITFRVVGPMADDGSGISVTVRDLSGRVVWEGREDGSVLRWHAHDAHGRPVPNGVYVYDVQAKLDGAWTPVGTAKLLIVR